MPFHEDHWQAPETLKMRSNISKISLACAISGLLLASLNPVVASPDDFQELSATSMLDETLNIEPLEVTLSGDKEDNLDAFQEDFNEGVVNPDGVFISGPKVPVTSYEPKGDEGSTDSRILADETPKIDSTGGFTIESAQVEEQPAISELTWRNKTPALIAQICRSREFQPTLENYWVSGADEWLKNYTVENRDEQDFKSHGLFGSIAKKYLDCDGFYQGGKNDFPRNSCSVKCSDVVSRVDDVQKAKKILFVLNSMAGFAKKAGIIYDAMVDVPKNVAELVNRMPPEGWRNTPASELGDIVFDTLNTVILAASPSVPAEELSRDGHSALQAAKHYYDQAVQVTDEALRGNNPLKYEKAFNSEYEPSLTDLHTVSKDLSDAATNNVFEGMLKDAQVTKAVLRWKSVLEDARTFATALDDGSLDAASIEGSQTLKSMLEADQNTPGYKKQVNEAAKIDNALDDVITIGRNKLLNTLMSLLYGDSSSVDGVTKISTILRHGNYLEASSESSMAEFEDIPIGRGISREIFMKLFNNSLRAQSIYISCTRDVQRSCVSDRSGPQDTKACVSGGYVCYMYEWNDQKNRHKSWNRRPLGFDDWSEKPLNIDVVDIILGSFETHMRTEPANNLLDLNTLGEAQTAQFSVPVCISDYNWNTKLERDVFCEINKNCSAKSMPCHCGPWGKDTLSVWKGIGLMESRHHDYYSETLCPRQIQKKISDPLERYVAYCNLNVRRWSGGSRVDGIRRHQGRDKYCGAILAALEAMPKNSKTQEMPRSKELDTLDPSTKFTLLCQIKKGGRGCPMYKKTFENIWTSWNESNVEVELV